MKLYCKSKTVMLGVPLDLTDKLKWHTSFGRVGHHLISKRIVNVPGQKDKSLFIYLIN